MKQSTAPTLSRHLLLEADRFLLYPQRIRRTRSNSDVQKGHDRILRMLVEWRKTFAPGPQDELTERCNELLSSPVLLDEFYCRDLLNAVPAIVERTVKL